MKVVAEAIVALSIASASVVEASPRKNVSGICDGCLATVPDGTEPAPLLVTLHGDWGHMAPDLHRAWERFASPRDVAVLSLACPTALGCKGSFWQWNGDPSWIEAQVDRLAANRAIDRERLWIAGWSGGATYIGMHTQAIERTFAGIVIHGGGHWPTPDDCPSQKAKVVFLVGDRNPLHAHGLALRDHYTRCGNELAFHLLRGAEHDAEWKALGEKGAEVFAELATARLARPAPTETKPAVAASAAPPPPEPAPTPPPAPQARPAGGCGCTMAGSGAARFGPCFGAIVLFMGVFRRRRAGARRTKEPPACGTVPL